MSRYIYADALWEYANNQKDKSIDANDFMRFPSIDIVRCKECEYWHELWALCTIDDDIPMKRKPDDFCSKGEERQ